MDKRKIKLIKHIDKTIEVSGAKVYGMHMLAIASLAHGKTYIDNILINDDFLTLLNALEKIGIGSDFTYSTRSKSKDITIIGTGGDIASYIGEIHIQNSAISLNFLMSMLTLGQGIYFVSTGEKLKERSIIAIADILKSMDINIKSKDDKYPPVLIEANGFKGGKIYFNEKISPQIIASLLITAPYAKEPLEMHFNNSATISSYTNITIDCMKQFGVEVETDGFKYLKVQNKQKYEAPEKIKIEPDIAIAIHFFAIAAIVGGRVRVDNINYYDTKQDYVKFIDVLEQMGCTVVKDKCFIEVSRDTNACLHGINVDMKDMKMLTQLLSVIALKCDGETIITNCNSDDYTTDRLHITCSELANVGASIERLDNDTIKIIPQKNYHGATIDTYNDYRMAMSFSLLGTFIDNIYISDEHSITKTYADFFDVLDSLAK